MSEGAPARLRSERLRLGLNQVEFGKLGGVSKNTQLAYENGGSPIPLDYLARLAEHGVDLVFVVSNVRDERADTSKSKSEHLRGDAVELQEFDLAYGMGVSFIDQGSVEKKSIVFSRAWIRNFTSSPIDKLFFARGIGDSMEPKIFDSDIVLIDTAQDTPRMWDQIWALDVGGLGMIKRLRPEKDGGIRLISDNKDVPDYVAYDGEMRIVGRVVAIVRKV